MDATDQSKGDTKVITAQHRGEVIAYAVQSGINNIAANFYEPWLNQQWQKYWDPSTHGNYGQNFKGELAGDLAGMGSLIVAEMVAPEALHTGMRAARRFVHPFYTSVAHMRLADQRFKPDYEQQIEKWTTQQERNLVRSAFMGTAGMIANVIMQKQFLHNESRSAVILSGKFLTRILTSVVGLGIRFILPGPMEKLDKTMSKHLFAPMMEDAKIDAPEIENLPTSHAERLLGRKKDEPPQLSR